jgi:L-rhamnose mutarotase
MKIRKAFLMHVNSDMQDEYQRRHNPIWEELETALRNHGVRTYSIFLHSDTNQLFAYVEFESEEQWERISETEACKRWWKYMKDIMPTNADDSPVSSELREVFHLGT